MRHVLVALFLLQGSASAAPLPSASPEDLPRWRGFNLLEKFHKEWSNGPFLEEDFRLISELGFNFVRLPMDYRTWIEGDDWTRFDEAVLQEIDQAVAWGGEYGVHVCLNFHRAPGYTVASPKEPTDLWTDEETQAVCAMHWAQFARRYNGIPSDRLSFNLFNEPAGIEPAVYARVAGRMAEAIRAEDPDRLIIADGLAYGRDPCAALNPLRVARATRGYEPMAISHYKAGWIGGSEDMHRPSWPLPEAVAYLYGDEKAEWQSPMRLVGPLTKPYVLRLRVGTVSGHGELVVSADGGELWRRTFACGPGEGEWREVNYVEEWDVYQNRFDRDYAIELPSGIKEVTILNVAGDWLTVSEIGLKSANGEETLMGLDQKWGVKQSPVRLSETEDGVVFTTSTTIDRDWLWEHAIAPWKVVEEQGVGVMVGEWGAYNKTPHDVTLHWMEDCLKNWRKAGWGWALWNFRGSFGILDSERADVVYEDWKGHRLDREMLELLLRY